MAVYSTGRIFRSDAMKSLFAEMSMSSVRKRTYVIDICVSQLRSAFAFRRRNLLDPGDLDLLGAGDAQ